MQTFESLHITYSKKKKRKKNPAVHASPWLLALLLTKHHSVASRGGCNWDDIMVFSIQPLRSRDPYRAEQGVVLVLVLLVGPRVGE